MTIDGVRFVADSGRGKIMLHDASSRSSALREGWISQASADQRKGRSGRTGPGVCFRLFAQAEFKAMPLATPPEIMRADLEGLVLQLKLLAGEGTDPRTFPWLDPPAIDSIEQSIYGLRDAGAQLLIPNLHHPLQRHVADASVRCVICHNVTFPGALTCRRSDKGRALHPARSTPRESSCGRLVREAFGARLALPRQRTRRDHRRGDVRPESVRADSDGVRDGADEGREGGAVVGVRRSIHPPQCVRGVAGSAG